MLDLRLPSGLFFAITGITLMVYGIADPSARAALTNANVDLYTGGVMAAFGVILLVLARKGKKA
jgi:hypothetical protein